MEAILDNSTITQGGLLDHEPGLNTGFQASVSTDEERLRVSCKVLKSADIGMCESPSEIQISGESHHPKLAAACANMANHHVL